MTTRKSVLFLQLVLLVAASLPPASKQMEVSLKKWLADNQLLYTTPDAEDTAMDAGVVAASKGYVLSLKPGQVFREKVVVGKGKPFVTLKSDPANPAVIVWNDTAATLGKDGEPLGHVRSATLTVEADNFVASGVVIKNDAPSGVEGGKTVALRVAGTKASFFKCTIEAGGQGAVYDDDGQHYFKECTINGGADAIFGFGRSWYDGCRVVSKKDPATVVSTTTAQTQRAPKYEGLDGTTNPAFLGFSFHNCTIEVGAGGGADDKVYLGRAWDDSSFVVFSNTMMANEVVPIGFQGQKMEKPAEGSGAYYGVYKCSGPGLEASKKMGWAKELTDGFPYANQEFISGETWILPPPTPTD
uniref:pectinesterase n=1 Tax=Oryza barthii TaxID=65489 RepID=A0A0D3HPM5_9ORYZ